MRLRLPGSEANLLKGCGLEFAHSVTRSPAAAADSPTGRGDKQLEQLRKVAGVASIVAIVKHDQFLAVRAYCNQFREGAANGNLLEVRRSLRSERLDVVPPAGGLPTSGAEVRLSPSRGASFPPNAVHFAFHT